MLRTLAVAVLGLAAAGLFAGCSSVGPVAYDEDPRIVKLRAGAAAPLDFGVTVGLPALPDLSALSATRHPAYLDARELQSELMKVLKGEKVFRAVARSLAETRDGQLREGWNRRDDLLLQVDVKRADVTYEGINGWFYANVFIWFYAWAPSWWIADETYAANLEVTLRVVSVHSGREVFRKEIPLQVKHELDDFDRGWSLLATLFPGRANTEGWKKVAKLIVPHVVHELKVSLFDTVRNEIPAVAAEPKFAQDMAKTLYLGIGVRDQKSYLVRPVAWAENDATALGAAIQSGLQLGGRNVLLVNNAQATKDNILAAVRDFLAARARGGDTLVCYIGGRGLILPDGRPAIAPYVLEPKQAAQDALPLADLMAALDEVAGTAIVIVDVGWGGAVDGRGLADLDDVAQGTCDAAVLDAFGRDGRMVLYAGGPTDGAFEIDENRHSLLVYYLLEALEGAADADDDGRVTAAEAAAYAARETARAAGLEGNAQTPRVAGTAAEAVLALTGAGGGDGR